MQIQINGRTTTLDNSIASVTSLLEHLEVDQSQIAVEKNFEIIPKSLYDATSLTNGDTIELVEFVGGG